MRLRVLTDVGMALVFAGFFAQEAIGQEVGKIPLQIKVVPGQKLTYKNFYRMSFFVDRAKELVASHGESSYQIDVSWEWTQDEVFKVDQRDTLIVATLMKTSDLTMINRQTVAKDVYPWSLEEIKGMELNWRVGPQGDVTAFGPLKEPGRLTLLTLVSDLRLITEGDFYPPLPAEPKAVGESWTSERKATAVYEEFQNFEAQIKATSTSNIKGMKKKGNRNCAEIEETRRITYKGWMNMGYVAPLILEGEGEARGNWLLDVDNGVVVEHKVRMDVEPKPTVVGETSPRNIETRLTIWMERKLEK